MTSPTSLSVISRLRGGLIVSCQAGPESALHEPIFIAALAREAERGGAVGLRINGPQNVAAVRRVTSLPILGIYKQDIPGYEVYITPTFESAREVVAAGADIVALDGTYRPRPGNLTLPELIAQIHERLQVLVMADISTAEEGYRAAEAGADLIATTLAGYTPYSRPPQPHQPDLELIRELAANVSVPIIAEGRITTPEQALAVLEAGAYALVVGTAITAPAAITRRFVEALASRQAVPR
jgi:N-acylglucosamine-6-phosphate 2-epimerase